MNETTDLTKCCRSELLENKAFKSFKKPKQSKLCKSNRIRSISAWNLAFRVLISPVVFFLEWKMCENLHQASL